MAALSRCAILTALAATACTESAPPPPTRAMAEALVQKLDEAFAHHDAAGLWETFVGCGHLGDAFARDLGLIEADTPLSRRSRIVDFDVIGGRGVALVETRLDDPEPGGCSLTEQRYLTLVSTEDGPRATLLATVGPHGREHVSKGWTGVYTCPPCDFRIGDEALSQWLVVPGAALLTGCVEVVAFHRLGAPLRVSLAVVHDPDADDATSLLEALLEDRHQRAPVVAGLPAGVDARPDVAGASADLGSAEGEHVQLHLVTRQPGPDAPPAAIGIGYLLTVRGTDAALHAHRDEVDRLLASFWFLPTERSAAEVGLDSVHAHGGGTIDADNGYHNDRYHVHCRGPAGWSAFARADRGLFQASFVCPEGGGQIKITGLPIGPGDPAEQRRQVAERLQAELSGRGLHCDLESAWQPAAGGVMLQVEVHADDGSSAVVFARVWQDLWTLIDGEPATDRIREALTYVRDSLARD